MTQYFIVSTNTDIGKTFLVTQLCQKLRAENILVDAIKPVASGFKYDQESDTAKILHSLEIEFNMENINRITPWRLEAPLSPSIAARRENIKIDFDKVTKFCFDKIHEAQINKKILLIEGAGGVMTPINQDKTFLDLLQKLNIPVLLMGANYLGAINHTLCAVEALKSRSIQIKKIIINNNIDQNLDITETIAEIKHFSCIETIDIDDFLQKATLLS